MKRTFFTAFLVFAGFTALSQSPVLTGRVYNKINNEPIPFAAVVVLETEYSTVTDADGNYIFTDLPPGLYNVQCQFIGFKTLTQFEIQVVRSRPKKVDFAMEEQSQQLEEVVVNAQTQFEKVSESPVSLNRLGVNEIERNPGGNMDISRVIQSLPGVASGVAFRNDIIVRGGGPNENRFYLDGIEIPAINHFATQGSSGGPVGLINVLFIREVDFFTGAFPADRGNVMSSLMEIKLKDGRDDRVGGTFLLGASDVGLTLEGPLGKNTTFLASARRSYLQFLFSALELPFLPTYNDFQFKVKTKLSPKDQLTVLGLGAIDNFRLNLDANETPEQRYILNYLPVNEQWNYSLGAKYTRFHKNSYTNVVLSRFMLNNSAFKFRNNDRNDEQILDYLSQEIENKLRVEHHFKAWGWKAMAGGGFEEVKYNTQTLDKRLPAPEPLDYTSDLRLYKSAVFGRASRSFFAEKLDVSFGLRADGINFNQSMGNPLNQLSPRIALSYNFTDALSINANWGIYYQLPPYTTLGFRNADGDLVNTDMEWIRSDHYIAGLAYVFNFNGRLSLEGFYKRYQNYPFLLPDSVSLANLGGDFGVIGNREARSISNGRAYGADLSYQQKIYKGFFGVAAFTYVRSEFDDGNGNFAPSSWDNRFYTTITGGKKLKGGWEIGIQYQFLGGAPYTPADLQATSLRANWDNIGFAVPNFRLLNTERLGSINRLNIRVDKKWFFEKYALNIYLDIQNALAQQIDGVPFVDVIRDSNGSPQVDPDDPSRYLIQNLPNAQGTVLPTLGVMFQF